MPHSTTPPKLNVLHITASSKIGGGPEHIWQLVRNTEEDVRSFIAAPDRRPYGDRFIDLVGKERVLTIPQRSFSLSSLWELIRFIKRNRIDIIHSHGKGAGLYARLAAFITGTCCVHTFHGIHLPKGAFLRIAYTNLERILCTISKMCITVSDGEKALAGKLNFSPRKLKTILNGVNVGEEIPERIPTAPFKLVHVSRFDPVKNSKWLIQLAKAMDEAGMLKQCRFVLVGDGEERATMEQEVQQAGLSYAFEFAGMQPSVLPFFENAGCLISTSLREGLPLAVLEAQAAGVPCIVTNVVGNAEAIEDGKTGFLYPLRDEKAAMQCISELINNQALWSNMCINAHRRALEHFSSKQMSANTLSVYFELMQTTR
ncbi:glycosyltransferase [Desulfovibrio subterraneus]|jgi:glycosyltransferase involved in cell wall biosynthesis|uniref:glycosyltransferase n=1 Tax=Desulfovibrio subterraneus TaxID=2718620 RepID=UPI0022B8FA87|nr:glycosyltransferase [Desulfovibrio subterraneus]WBF66191.1 glycosyltransferase [Desulfovibrio subterraneus]